MDKPELFIVVGPNGSGKSSVLYESEIFKTSNRTVVFNNADKICWFKTYLLDKLKVK